MRRHEHDALGHDSPHPAEKAGFELPGLRTACRVLRIRKKITEHRRNLLDDHAQAQAFRLQITVETIIIEFAAEDAVHRRHPGFPKPHGIGVTVVEPMPKKPGSFRRIAPESSAVFQPGLILIKKSSHAVFSGCMPTDMPSTDCRSHGGDRQTMSHEADFLRPFGMNLITWLIPLEFRHQWVGG